MPSSNDLALWNGKVGVFCPKSPMATDAGMEALNGPRDPARVRSALQATGYKGEKIGFLSAVNFGTMARQVDVAADQFSRAGLNVEVIPVEFGVWLQRRANRGPADQGGWSCATTMLSGLDLWDPTFHLAPRGNGLSAWPGWPTSKALETLRTQWVEAPDQPARQAITRRPQEQAFLDMPYVPTGQWRDLTAYRRNLTGMLTGMPLFYILQKG